MRVAWAQPKSSDSQRSRGSPADRRAQRARAAVGRHDVDDRLFILVAFARLLPPFEHADGHFGGRLASRRLKPEGIFRPEFQGFAQGLEGLQLPLAEVHFF